MNEFYVYKIGRKYLRVTKALRYRLTDLDRCAYWKNKKQADTWLGSVLANVPNAVLRRVTFKIISDGNTKHR